MKLERQLEINEARHHRADERHLAKMDAADALIGELMREGAVVHYINLHPLHKGKVKEGHPWELRQYLIRNRYV
jgi:hypothetical protein